MAVDRCVCFDVRFDTLQSTAEATGATSLRSLQDEVSFGHNCGRCHPYVRRMLETGQTVFSEIIREEDDSTGST